MRQHFKATILAASAILLSSTAAMAESLSDIFGEFKNDENVEYVKIPKFLFMLGRMSSDMDDNPIAKKISGMKVLDMSKSTQTVKSRFDKRFNQLSSGLDEMISVNEGKERVKILTKQKGDKYHNIYIFAADSADYALIEFSGTFTPADINAFIESENKKR